MSRAVVIDSFPAEKVFRMIATLTMVMVLANGLSPYVGGVCVKAFGWRSVFVLLSAAGLLMVFAAWRYIPETRSRPTGGAGVWHTALGLARRPVFIAYLIEGGVIIAIFQVFVATTPYIMQNEFHRTPQAFGVFTACVSGGYFIGNFLVTRLGHRWTQHSMLRTGLAIQLGFALALLALVWLAPPGPYPIYVPMVLLALGQGLALPQVNSAALTLSPQNAGLASSLIGFGQSILSSGSVQLVSLFPTGAGLPMIVFTVCASFVAVLCAWLVPHGKSRKGKWKRVQFFFSLSRVPRSPFRGGASLGPAPSFQPGFPLDARPANTPRPGLPDPIRCPPPPKLARANGASALESPVVAPAIDRAGKINLTPFYFFALSPSVTSSGRLLWRRVFVFE